MRKAIVLTAFNRPDYLADVLDSWLNVRGLEDWDFYISIDSFEAQSEVSSIAAYFKRRALTNVSIVGHSPNLGVLKHPYVALDALFSEGYDFVIRAEDDLVVSDGILDYFDWASRAFKDLTDVATVHAFSLEDSDDERLVYRAQQFNPWIFGTWKRAWPSLKDNWDLDYSTFEGTPGHKSGFDWNFNLRVFPKLDLWGIYPKVSRVKNIGAYGVHGRPEDLPTSPSFREINERHSAFDLKVDSK